VVATDWLLVSNVFLSTNPQDANRTHAVWRAFLELAEAAGYDARPSAERDFGFLIRSVGGSAAWLRCMLQYAYLEDWHTLRRHRPAVPFGHSFELVNFGGVGPLLALSPVSPPSTPVDLALEAARRSRGELVSTRRAGHGAIFLPVRTGIWLAPARASLPPAMATRCAKPRLLKYEYPPVIHQQQSLLQASPCHPIQGTAYVMMTAAIVSRLLRAYRKTHRIFQPSPCYNALKEKF